MGEDENTTAMTEDRTMTSEVTIEELIIVVLIIIFGTTEYPLIRFFSTNTLSSWTNDQRKIPESHG